MIDWLQIWRRMVEEREEQALRIRRKEGLEERVDYWGRRAQEFSQLSRETRDTDPLLQRLLQEVTPEMSVLDVGAGTGRHTIPLARIARKVFAVDPSETMLSFLQQEAQSQGLSNITVVNAAWEEAQVEPCDVVICSHSMYSIRDIGLLLSKLLEHTKVACFISIRITQFDAHLRELWELVHGEPRKLEANFIQLYNALYQLGVCANVEVVPFGSGRPRMWSYGDLQEALESCRSQLQIGPEPKRDAAIVDYLRGKLVEEGGRLYWSDIDMKAAIIRWPAQEAT